MAGWRESQHSSGREAGRQELINKAVINKRSLMHCERASANWQDQGILCLPAAWLKQSLPQTSEKIRRSTASRLLVERPLCMASSPERVPSCSITGGQRGAGAWKLSSSGGERLDGDRCNYACHCSGSRALWDCGSDLRAGCNPSALEIWPGTLQTQRSLEVWGMEAWGSAWSLLWQEWVL